MAGVVTLADASLTSEDIIQMDELPPDEELPVSTLVSSWNLGQTYDVVLEDLQPGTYTMACDFETESGVRHFMLGMVAQFDVI